MSAINDYVRWLRAHVGSQKVIFTGAAGLVRDDDGRALLQRRADNGLWGFPGGIQELGERADETVRREVLEEVGLIVEPEVLIGIYTSPELDVTYANGDQVQIFVAFFECRTLGGSLKAQAEEVLEVGWFDLTAPPELQPCCAAKARDALAFTGPAFFR